MKRRTPMGEVPLQHRISVKIDTFTHQSLQDMATELYDGNVARTVRAIVVKALEEWDAGEKEETDLRRIAIALETIAKTRRNLTSPQISPRSSSSTRRSYSR